MLGNRYTSKSQALITNFSTDAYKLTDKSVAEEETTCMSKLTFTGRQFDFSQNARVLPRFTNSSLEQLQSCSLDLDQSRTSKLQKSSKAIRCVIKLQSQLKELSVKLSNNRENINEMDRENDFLQTKIAWLQERLSKKFEDKRRKKNCFTCCID